MLYGYSILLSEEDWRNFSQDYWGPVLTRFALRWGAGNLADAEDVASQTIVTSIKVAACRENGTRSRHSWQQVHLIIGGVRFLGVEQAVACGGAAPTKPHAIQRMAAISGGCVKSSAGQKKREFSDFLPLAVPLRCGGLGDRRRLAGLQSVRKIGRFPGVREKDSCSFANYGQALLGVDEHVDRQADRRIGYPTPPLPRMKCDFVRGCFARRLLGEQAPRRREAVWRLRARV